MLLVLKLLGGCASGVYLMPTPVGLQEGRHDPFANTPEREQQSTIAVAYGTNRLPSDQGNYYGRDFDQNLRMGLVRVRIGDGDQSWEEIRNLSLHGLDRRDALLSITEVSEKGVLKHGDAANALSPQLQAAIDSLNHAIDSSPVREITIYVHGANNRFYRTAAQAAQYRHFTGRQAIVTLFSWPSSESLLTYGRDVSNIEQTVPTFARYIRLIARHTRAEKINILCYSLGATLTTRTLALLAEEPWLTSRDDHRSLRLGSVYFAAPDTDFDEFVEEYRSYRDIVDRVTVTINENDTVLGISQHLYHAPGSTKPGQQGAVSGKSRLGKPDISDLSQAQADWIIEQTRTRDLDVLAVDYSAIPGLPRGSHDYWYQNPWASTDALLTLNLHLQPAERGLEAISTDRGARVWSFPSDYETRVERTIEKTRQQYQQAPSAAGGSAS